MHIWFIKTGEGVPIDGREVRLMRTGVLARLFAEQGHEVSWFTATFNHFQKKHRFHENHTISISQKYKIHFLHGRGYSKNVSIERIRDHREVAKNFLKISSTLSKPDVMYGKYKIC